MHNEPSWLSEGWASQNKETLFIKRLRNTVYQIEMDKNIARPGATPMQTTGECLFGDVAVNATKFQWSETKKEALRLKKSDAQEAAKLISAFEKTYADYMPVLES